MRSYSTLCFSLFSFLTFSLSSMTATEPLTLQRPDGSLLTGYYDLSEQESFPIGIVIDGLRNDSVLPIHEDLIEGVRLLGGTLISLEKQGIFGPGNINEEEYKRTNDRNHRIKDHRQLLQAIRDGMFPGWNGKFIFIGGSEGGAIASVLSAESPETAASIILCSGGGWKTIDELRWSMRYHLKHEFGLSDLGVEALMQYADSQMDLMMNDPSTEKTFCFLTYKWWAGHLLAPRLFEIVKNIDTPIYFGHSIADVVIPIASADQLVEEYATLGKNNLTYRRIENVPHDLRHPTEDIFLDAFKWLEETLEINP